MCTLHYCLVLFTLFYYLYVVCILGCYYNFVVHCIMTNKRILILILTHQSTYTLIHTINVRLRVCVSVLYPLFA